MDWMNLQNVQRLPWQIISVWLAVAWLAASVVLISRWAATTGLGWRPLSVRRTRDNYLQLPTVFLIFLTSFILTNGLYALGMMLLPGQEDTAKLAAVIVGSLLMAGATIFLARTLFVDRLDGLGLNFRRGPRDALFGLAYCLVVLPVVLVVLQATTIVFQRVGLDTGPHPMLQRLRQSESGLVVGLTAFAAVVAAPLWEELLFRGIVQSFLVRFFRVMMPPKGWPSQALSLKPPEVARAEARDAIARALALGEQLPANLGVPPEPEAAGGQVEPLRPGQEARRAYAAIVITSILFATMHPAQSIPAIFVLSLALGYLYERTGSLICTIAMHATFNMFNFVMFLLGPMMRT